MAATQGHTQSLHTNALDEAIALPTDFSARIARNTQLLLQQESGTTAIIDAWGGSYYVEKLTHDLAERAWEHITEVEQAGGMAKAIEAGIPKMRIEEAAARTQARIDAGAQVVIGINTFALTDEEPLDVRTVDNTRGPHRADREAGAAAGRARPGAGAGRAGCAVRRPRTRDRPTRSTDAGDLSGNLLALAIDAARAKATVGEISDALEKVYGRHTAVVRTISGVYRVRGRQVGHRRRQQVGRRRARRDRGLRRGGGPTAAHPDRQDGPGRARPRAEGDRHRLLPTSASTSTSARCSPRPDEVAQQAVDNDVHVVGVNSLAAGHLTLVPALKAALAELGRPDIMIVVGGVIPPADIPALHDAGAAAVFGPGTVIAEAALDVLDRLTAALHHA